jgi:hypothetical protein
MQVPPRRAGRRLAGAGHQLPQVRPGRSGQGLPGVSQVVEAQVRSSGSVGLEVPMIE